MGIQIGGRAYQHLEGWGIDPERIIDEVDITRQDVKNGDEPSEVDLVRYYYQRENPNAHRDTKTYSAYAAIFEKSMGIDYGDFEEDWEIHYKRRLQEMDITDVIDEYRRIVEQTHINPDFEREQRLCIEELVVKLNGQAEVQWGTQSDDDDNKHLIIGDNGEFTLPLFLESVKTDGTSNITNIKINAPLKLYEAQPYQEAQAFRERLYSSANLREAFDIRYEHLNLAEVVGAFDMEVISAAVRGELVTEADPEGAYRLGEFEHECPRLQGVLYMPGGLEELSRNMEQLGPQNRLALQQEMGAYIGKLGKRIVAAPSGEALALVKIVADSELVAPVLQQVVEEESAFWGKTFDPIEDAIKLDFFNTSHSGAGSFEHYQQLFLNLEERLQWARYLSSLEFDMTRCADTPFIDDETNSGYFSVPMSGEESHLEGSGIYFGVHGGFRYWRKDGRAVIQNMPGRFLAVASQRNNHIIGGGEVSLPAWKLHYPREGLQFPTETQKNFIVDGAQLVLEPWDSSRFDYAHFMSLPGFQMALAPEVVASFKKYVPEALVETRQVRVDGDELPIPFIVLPKDTDPVIFHTLMYHHRIPNVAFEETGKLL